MRAAAHLPAFIGAPPLIFRHSSAHRLHAAAHARQCAMS
jgi:hypothetical protein